MRMLKLIIVSAVIVLISAGVGHAGEARYSRAELTKLVEPIALYPDSLLQQILPAATFPDQIADAALLIRGKEDAGLIEDQSWDNSVKIIASYSGILKMMYQKLDWTTELGKAFLDQHEEILDEIQELRVKAREQGNLESSQYQRVSTQTSSSGTQIVVIQSSDPSVVYVPANTGSSVYTQPVSTSSVLVPMATFGIGMALGAAMNDDDENHYYYGPPIWGGGYNDWAETRRARNEDFHDRVMDRQDFRQDQRADRQDFRQDWAADHPEQVNRQNVESARQNMQNRTAQRKDTYQNNQANRTAKLDQARANMKARDFSGGSGQSLTRNAGSGAWGGQGGGSFANRASSRGTASRSYGGGGLSRGGGGGFKGGRR